MTSPSVDHPKHYNIGGVEVIDAIESWQLGFCLGNAVKYIARAGHKDKLKEKEDLQKLNGISIDIFLNWGDYEPSSIHYGERNPILEEPRRRYHFKPDGICKWPVRFSKRI